MSVFDLATVATSRADAGVPMPLLHPKTSEALKNDDGSPVTITMRGRTSEEWQERMRHIQLTRAELSNQGQKITTDHVFDEDTGILMVCTVGWSIETLDGEPFPYNGTNALKLWTEARFRWIREQALRFILGDGNFLPEGSKISSASPSIVSVSANLSQAAE